MKINNLLQTEFATKIKKTLPHVHCFCNRLFPFSYPIATKVCVTVVQVPETHLILVPRFSRKRLIQQESTGKTRLHISREERKLTESFFSVLGGKYTQATITMPMDSPVHIWGADGPVEYEPKRKLNPRAHGHNKP